MRARDVADNNTITGHFGHKRRQQLQAIIVVQQLTSHSHSKHPVLVLVPATPLAFEFVVSLIDPIYFCIYEPP